MCHAQPSQDRVPTVCYPKLNTRRIVLNTGRTDSVIHILMMYTVNTSALTKYVSASCANVSPLL